MDHAHIADLLTQSRAAHVRYQLACARMEAQGGVVVFVPADPTAARAALKEAHDLRTQAHALDPTHELPAWDEEPANYEHDALLGWYREKLHAS